MIGSISFMSGYTPYDTISSLGTAGMSNTQATADGSNEAQTIKNAGESTAVSAGKKSSPATCQTCQERKYQDGSDEMVSFKSASHISPEAASSAVRAHEQEHVSNAYKKAAQKDGEVISATVSLKTAICPECGRSYVSGGETATQIRYPNEENPYQKNAKSLDRASLLGNTINIAC